MKFYFAYGSNLNRGQMDGRCPGNERLGWAVVFGYIWYISSRGYASIRESKADYVEGYLYRITAADERELDIYEAVEDGLYDKHEISVEHNGGIMPGVMTYIDPVTEIGRPQDLYGDAINQGIVDAQLTAAYVKKYIRPFIPEE